MILDEIIENKRAEVASLSLDSTPQNLSPAKDFISAVSKPGLNLIAEIKRKSPAGGSIRPGLKLEPLISIYEKNGAAAISVLTDETYFGGTVADLIKVKAFSRLPVLRKDFILAEKQIYESKNLGADAILLIVAVLTDAQLLNFLKLAQKLGMQSLVEVHTKEELGRALKTPAKLIGVNNRNLKTFKVDLSTSEKLIPKIPPDRVVVAESGVKTRADVLRLKKTGADAILVGEELLKAKDPGKKIKELFG